MTCMDMCEAVDSVPSAVLRVCKVLVPCYTSDCRTYFGDGTYHQSKSPGISVIAG